MDILGIKGYFWEAKNKANQTQSQLAPRPVLGIEKTKPIYSFSVRSP